MRSKNVGAALGTMLALSLGTPACRVTPTVQDGVTPSHVPSARTTTAFPTTAAPPAATALSTSTPRLIPATEPTTSLPPTAATDPSPTPPDPRSLAVHHRGISFAVDPVLGDEVYERTETDSLAYAELSFALEGSCRDVGCITIHPVESYRETIPFGADVIDGLQSAMETHADDTFPALMAHILLRAKTSHLRFQNGAGMRAIVMKGQDVVYANNESVVYEFHGLTDDGRYYVAATFPIDAPMLLSRCCDPTGNTNLAAIPAPELPDDDIQAGTLIRGYNQEAERQLNALEDCGFTPNLALLDELVRSLLIAPSSESGPAPMDGIGSLQVDVDYRGTWYREMFDYTKAGENIAHFILVLPESDADRATATRIFGSIDYTNTPDALTTRPGEEEFHWALEHVYHAPGGRFRGQFEAGTYYVAAAFAAAPVDKEAAGHPQDAILYAGMTGGGASSDYRRIEIGPGENAVTVSLTDQDGWACPWLYVHDGDSFDRRTEILRNIRGKQNERTENTPIGMVEIVHGSITLRIVEEKDEITFIDELYLLVEGIELRVDATTPMAAKVARRDHDYLVISSNDSRQFRFRLPDALAGVERAAVSVVVSGFYQPREKSSPLRLVR